MALCWCRWWQGRTGQTVGVICIALLEETVVVQSRPVQASPGLCWTVHHHSRLVPVISPGHHPAQVHLHPTLQSLSPLAFIPGFLEEIEQYNIQPNLTTLNSFLIIFNIFTFQPWAISDITAEQWLGTKWQTTESGVARGRQPRKDAKYLPDRGPFCPGFAHVYLLSRLFGSKHYRFEE